MYYRKWHQMPSFIPVVLTHRCQFFISFYIALKGQLFIEGKLLMCFTGLHTLTFQVLSLLGRIPNKGETCHNNTRFKGVLCIYCNHHCS